MSLVLEALSKQRCGDAVAPLQEVGASNNA